MTNPSVYLGRIAHALALTTALVGEVRAAAELEPPPAGEVDVNAAPAPAPAATQSGELPPPMDAAAAPVADDIYTRAFALAEDAAARGDLRGAARLLQTIRADYPEDVDLILRIAALHAAAAERADAERAYREALRLSPASREANRGLGVLLDAQQRCGEALPALERAAPEDPIGRAALARCRAVYPVQIDLGVFGGSLFYQTVTNSPTRSPVLVLGARLDALIAERLALTLLYRGRANLPPTDLMIPGLSVLRAQHEAYATVGYTTPRGGLSLHYAFLADQGGPRDRAHVVGASGRLALYGDALLELSASLYPDMTVLRGAIGYRLPLWRSGVSITPVLSLQYAPDQTLSLPLVNGALTLAYARPRFDLFAGGKYGAELRPAYLGLSIVSNYLEVTRFGLFGGLSLALGSLDRPAGRGIFRMALSYSLERLSAADVGQIYGFSHAINLGLSRAF